MRTYQRVYEAPSGCTYLHFLRVHDTTKVEVVTLMMAPGMHEELTTTYIDEINGRALEDATQAIVDSMASVSGKRVHEMTQFDSLFAKLQLGLSR